ncbi:MAG: LLM class flavin-dependent oxidoreductase [Janthinobacterium lividum]
MSSPLALSCVVLPDSPPAEFVARVRDVEQARARTAWTYDHLSWGELREGPWFATVPLIAAAAAATGTVRLGTQVATPNFRHPIPFAQEVMTLDHLSRGRLDLGVGAGARDSDSRVLGQTELTMRERADRFEEWAILLLEALAGGVTDHAGPYYVAVDARTLPGCFQTPHVPLTVAATGPRGMRIAAEHADAWVTYGPYDRSLPPDEWLTEVGRQNERFSAVLDETAPHRAVRRIAQVAASEQRPFVDPGAYAQLVQGLADAGFDEVSVHWPRADGRGVPAKRLDDVVAVHLG